MLFISTKNKNTLSDSQYKSAGILLTIIPTLAFALVLLFAQGHQPVYAPADHFFGSPKDSSLFQEKQEIAKSGGNIAEKTLLVANSFLGTPYVGGCLDCNAKEELVINMRALDCWTFVEYSLAIALSQEESYGFFETQVQQLRYWGGNVDGYASRIHYFTGWILQAEKCGLLKDISAELGGIPYEKKIGYISARKNKYPKIQDSAVFNGIMRAEKRISTHNWFYIPKSKIAQMEHLIQEGDIVCITSMKPDLDIAHQGFAVKKNGRIHLMHASSLAGKVIVANLPLAQYAAAQRGQSGIMVARLNQD